MWLLVIFWLAVFSSLKCRKVSIWYSETYWSYPSIVCMLSREWTMSRIHVSGVDCWQSARLGTTAILIEFGIIVWITGTLRWIEKLLACVSERERERENFSRHTNRNKTSNGTKIYMRDRLPFLLTKKWLPIPSPDYWCSEFMDVRATAPVMMWWFTIYQLIQVGDSVDW